MKSIRNIFLAVIFVLITNSMFAYIWVGDINKTKNNNNDNAPQLRATANCEPPKTSTDLDVNNVRARIHTGGDMWWDLQSKPAYEIPKGSGTHALFAGSIWIGGKDSYGQLKLAAQRFRANGFDFWPGPLMSSGAEKGNVSAEICREYDKHFAINKQMVIDFREWFRCSHDPTCKPDPNYTIPEEITNWPGNGPAGNYDQVLAPYWDLNDDKFYNPMDGDFPFYEFINEDITDDKECLRKKGNKSKLYGDYTLWWVYNDRGNIHSETKGSAIGMEFRSQAFAYTTNDELNNMTFFNYNIKNQSTYTLYDTYFGVWTDADLGNPTDDYVGCDVLRGLGYCYNGDNDDETASGHTGYGSQPPAIGIDFFEGPYQDDSGIDKPSAFKIVNGVKKLDCTVLPENSTNNGLYNGNINGLNFGDGMPNNERWGMRRFLYFNNENGTPTSDPDKASEYYNYIIGKWKDDSPLYFGGTGHKSSSRTNTSLESDFMFPGMPTTDDCNWGTKGNKAGDWSEVSEKNPKGDRRFVQSAGPFTLKPGAINDITLGAVWARALSGGAWASVQAVQKADDKAQSLFENCFRTLDGPDAPDLTIIELDKKLIFQISNKVSSNNYLDKYVEVDKAFPCEGYYGKCDTAYRFQGYQIFQLKNKSVTVSDRKNEDICKSIFICDINDNIGKIINFEWSDELNANVPQLEVQGLNNGIVHTFVLDKDVFNDNKNLINNREYYFTAIAYGYNNSTLYNQNDPKTNDNQKKPYLAGRKNIKQYIAVPHKNEVLDGMLLNSDYGSGLPITMYEGYGNGNFAIDLTDDCINEIMSGYPWNTRNKREYKAGSGPIGVYVINPLNLIPDSYYVKFDSIVSNQYGILGTNVTLPYGATPISEFTYSVFNSNGDTLAINQKVTLNGIVYNSSSFIFGHVIENVFEKYGFSIKFYLDNFSLVGNNPESTSVTIEKNKINNGFLSASVELNDSLKRWLAFLPDADGETPFNWIRSGSNRSNNANHRYDDVTHLVGSSNFFADPNGDFGKIQILGGNWAPFILTSSYTYGLKPRNSSNAQESNLKIYGGDMLSSVNIYFTSDTAKWSKSCVVEMCENERTKTDNDSYVNIRSIGSAKKFSLRKSPSIDKLGKPLNDGTHGMSWFPGYAIDVRTGERLNIAFGEDSSLPDENGQDLIWNPTTKITSASGKILVGGKHAIYVFGNNLSVLDTKYDGPLYDSCAFFYKSLIKYETSNMVNDLITAYQSAMWCAIPYLNYSYLNSVLKNPDDWKNPMKFIQTDIKISLRVATPYTKGIREFANKTPQNKNYPYFSFNTVNSVPDVSNISNVVKDNLPFVNIVPNPYYGYSTFENQQLDTYVRITNLPRKCDVKIYNSNGTLVRSLYKNNGISYLEWDLKNSNNVAIASGMYLIHIRAYDPNDSNAILGEKILKWFGALRPVDLNNF
jgi:hypothetical protein